jgi:hypothetical protein
MNMTTASGPIELPEEEYTAELAEGLKEYRAAKEQEGPGFQPLTADKLPKEIKEALGLDLFPEDIQNAMVALVVKITDYALQLADKVEQEAPFGAPQSTWNRFATCARQAPIRDLMRDAWRGGSTAASYGRILPKPYQPMMRPLGAFATFGAGFAGHTIGCMRR